MTLIPLAEKLEASHSPARFPIIFLVFIFSGFLPAAIYGIGMGWIATTAASKATYPLVYLILAGIGAFLIRAPNGETSIFAMLSSIGAYVVAIVNKKVVHIFENFWDFIMALTWIIIPLVLLWLVVLWINSLFSKGKEIRKIVGESIEDKVCPRCNRGYDGSWEICLNCSERLIENPKNIIEAESKVEKKKRQDEDGQQPVY